VAFTSLEITCAADELSHPALQDEELSKPLAIMFWRLLSFLALSIGLALTAWFVPAATLTAILHSLAEIEWGVLAIIAVRAIMVATNGIPGLHCWQSYARGRPASSSFCVGYARPSTPRCR
jgi:hypothetical protein